MYDKKPQNPNRIQITQVDFSMKGKIQTYKWQNEKTSLGLCSQWEVPPDYINVILGIKDNLTKDLVYILMAKGLHCISIKVCL